MKSCFYQSIYNQYQYQYYYYKYDHFFSEDFTKIHCTNRYSVLITLIAKYSQRYYFRGYNKITKIRLGKIRCIKKFTVYLILSILFHQRLHTKCGKIPKAIIWNIRVRIRVLVFTNYYCGRLFNENHASCECYLKKGGILIVEVH